MPGLTSSSGDTSIVPHSPEVRSPVVFPLHHGLKPPISRLSISWSRGNSLRVSVFRQPQSDADESGGEVGGKVVEVKLSKEEAEMDDAQWRRIAYGSVTPFAVLQSRKNSMSTMSKTSGSNPYAEWSDYITEYSKEINCLLGNQKLPPHSVIEDSRTVLQNFEEPTLLKAAWVLMEIFYADKQFQPWIPERLVDWLYDYDSLFAGMQPTIHSKLVDFQIELVNLQAVEDDHRYWEVVSSALAIGWLDIVVKLLRLHSSYQHNQIGSREFENGLVEAVAVLITKMPRMRPDIADGKLGECYEMKPEFVKAWEKWRGQITKLDCSAFWLQCGHQQTKEGLKNMLQIMLGNASVLSTATYHWVELYIAHFLYIRPFTTGMDSMYNLAQKCMQSKPVSSSHTLMEILISILGENIEVILAECLRSFGPWSSDHVSPRLH